MIAELPFIASCAGAARARVDARIQSLWGGYGSIVRVALEGGVRPSVVVKCVEPKAPPVSPEGARSHARKCRSYAVEMAFYRAFAGRCDASCKVPELLGGWEKDGRSLFVLEDLDAAGYAARVHAPSPVAIELGLGWLASFHARFLGTSPDGLWEEGTYWHLATRPDELLAVDDDALRAAAPVLDAKLRAGAHRTIVHGDAKLANFCFADGAVAAVDFQYAGGGAGVKDVAYFLGSCSRRGAEIFESRYLDVYFARLRAELRARGTDVEPDAVEAEWRALYPIAGADFFRFLAGWAPAEWRRDDVGQRLVREVLRALG